MSFLRPLLLLGAVAALSGCLENDTERAVAGALAGGALAAATENDVATGVALGAAAGVFCDNLNVPGCVRRY